MPLEWHSSENCSAVGWVDQTHSASAFTSWSSSPAKYPHGLMPLRCAIASRRRFSFNGLSSDMRRAASPTLASASMTSSSIARERVLSLSRASLASLNAAFFLSAHRSVCSSGVDDFSSMSSFARRHRFLLPCRAITLIGRTSEIARTSAITCFCWAFVLVE